MASPKLTKEQAELQKVRLAEEVERRKALGNAGKQKNLAGKLKELLPSALENIKHVVEGTGDIDKNRYDASKWIVSQSMVTEKHAHELKLRRLAAKKAESEANAGGYGDKTPAKVKEEFEQKGLRPVGGFEYKPEWDEEVEEFETEEDSDE